MLQTLEIQVTKPKGKSSEYHVRLATPDGHSLAEGDFTYRLDPLSVLTELERFEPSSKTAHERIERIRSFGTELLQKVFQGTLQDQYKKLRESADWFEARHPKR